MAGKGWKRKTSTKEGNGRTSAQAKWDSRAGHLRNSINGRKNCRKKTNAVIFRITKRHEWQKKSNTIQFILPPTLTTNWTDGMHEC